MIASRLQVTSLFVTLFADRIRLSAYEDKKDLVAYERAVAAFNAITDEHDAAEAPKLAKRRTAAALCKATRAAA
jgi:hypothetical protein